MAFICMRGINAAMSDADCGAFNPSSQELWMWWALLHYCRCFTASSSGFSALSPVESEAGPSPGLKQ
ncbi:hypothetical protein OPV22_009064 [Ensete ventricosum]|uniref:Uncharacterized protein n=1 Tax=Ensete ventricosum TaxID=4639 RepID=A0AAV8RID0_ENSVE|nr:hypothetical protein OPV22_009064 [Ensete ventricosum]